jgi:hypothetical protein
MRHYREFLIVVSLACVHAVLGLASAANRQG